MLHAGPQEAITLVGAGVTLHAHLAAADGLEVTGTAARVIELYSVKPDTETLRAAATDGRFVVAEDHHLEAGLRSIVTDALPGVGQQPLQVAHLAVREMPGSGTGAELMAAADIEVAAFIPSSMTGKVANVCRQRYQGPRSRPGTRSPSPQGLGAGRVAVVH